MNNSMPSALDWGQVVSVPTGDRWSIHRRLKELQVPCACPTDGTLRVDVNHAMELLLVHSVLRQFTAPRQAGVDWLERCLAKQVLCTRDY